MRVGGSSRNWRFAWILLIWQSLAAWPQGDPLDQRIPADLPESQRALIARFLRTNDSPNEFIPSNAKVVGELPAGLAADAPPKPVKQYLAAVVPDTPAESGNPPKKAAIYWYRPNPRPGIPGVTIRRFVDLQTGESVGQPEVLFNHATPLTREEREAALQLAYNNSPELQRLYAQGNPHDVRVSTLIQVITASGQADGTPGDRVVALQYQRWKTNQRVRLMVNLTKSTVRNVNAP